MNETTYDSPVGTLRLIGSSDGLRAVLWPTDTDRVPVPDVTREPNDVLTTAVRQLDQYFSGGRTSFDIPLDPVGTAFQRTVWNALEEIPYGSVQSYGALARSIDRPSAARAVGAANGKNPISIIVPCHRVIGSSGRLTGFAGGLDVKQHLLAHEQAVLSR